jgi:dihydroorotase
MQAPPPPTGAAHPGTRLTIARPDDWHLHVRDGAGLKAVVPASARVFGRAVIMPNTVPPVTTVDMVWMWETGCVVLCVSASKQGLVRGSGELFAGPNRHRPPFLPQALAYRARVLAAAPPGSRFEPRMALYLTQDTTGADVAAAAAAGCHGFKLYPAGATTNSAAGVTDVRGLGPVLDAMAGAGLPLLVHGEVADPAVDTFDRERVFLESFLSPLVDAHPTLKVVLEHVTTADAVAFVAGAREGVAATVTPQHMTLNRTALFAGGLRPHAYCLPILKRERHRAAVAAAATGGSGRFFLGSDSAPHARAAKECACGCAGIYSAPAALPLYAAAFEAEGALSELEGFASLHGARFYGLPPPSDTVTLIRDDWELPASMEFGEGEVVPMGAGETLRWRVEE